MEGKLSSIIQFDHLTFGQGSEISYQYTVLPTGKQITYYEEPDGSGSRAIITPRLQDSSIEFTDTSGFPNLRSCSRCSPDNQAVHWRSFTEPARISFLSQKGWGRPLDFPRQPLTVPASRSNEYYDAPANFGEEPGCLWISRDPFLANAVGISRGLVERESLFTWL